MCPSKYVKVCFIGIIINPTPFVFLKDISCSQFTADGAVGLTGARAALRVESASGDGTEIATRPGRPMLITPAMATISTMRYALVQSARVNGKTISTI